MKTRTKFLVILLIMLVLSCNQKQTLNKPLAVAAAEESNQEDVDNLQKKFEVEEGKDSLLKDLNIHRRIKQSLLDTNIILLTSELLRNPDYYKEIKPLGDINGDQIVDSIMIIPEFYYSVEGGYVEAASVIFTDSLIPRIKVASGCLKVDFIFPVKDIDEDGILELGKYYTSCASRFKLLELVSLQDNEWITVGDVIFDLWYDDPPIEKRVRKIKKNKFALREITDMYHEEGKVDRWVKFELK